jgi:aromatic-L-amino-acid/L-tryptophan decarboxylase
MSDSQNRQPALAAELGDLPAAEFRRLLHQTADWIADYRETIEQRRVSPDKGPGAISGQLPLNPPESPELMSEVLSDFERIIMPGVVHWGHPAFLGYFATTTTAPGILGEMIAAALNVSAMTWQTSPAATELEAVVRSLWIGFDSCWGFRQNSAAWFMTLRPSPYCMRLPPRGKSWV